MRIETSNMEEYLKSSEIIDYYNNDIKDTAYMLKDGTTNEIELAKKCFEYVRDNIYHTFDIKGNVVTCKASEVLKYREGVCYAKSHLLAAILRCLGIPTGFCYQKLILSDKDNRILILHGLNGIYLKDIKKWIRVDARGNKPGVDAQFSIHEEKLAFHVRKQYGEVDYDVIYVNPDKNVIRALRENKTSKDLRNNLPRELYKSNI